jgi:hypothetical protein
MSHLYLTFTPTITPARLVPIETRELAWQRGQFRAHHAICASADPVLVSVKTLSSGCRRGSRRPFPPRCTHDRPDFVRVHSSPERRAFQEVRV